MSRTGRRAALCLGLVLAAGCGGASGSSGTVGSTGYTPLEFLGLAILALSLAIVIYAIYRRRFGSTTGITQLDRLHGPRGDEIFRFVDVRPPSAAIATKLSTIEVREHATYLRRRGPSELASQLRAASGRAARMKVVDAFADAWPKREEKSGSDVKAFLASVKAALEEVRGNERIATFEQLERTLTEALGAASAEEYVTQVRFAELSALVWDGCLAQRIARRRELPPLAALRDGARAIALLELLTSDDGLDSSRGNILKAANASLLLPPPAGHASAAESEEEIETGVVGAVNVLGFGDLRLVRQEVVCYEPGEIAHVENVMGRERRERSHTRTRRFEETTLEESETSRETERDLKTEERFELQKETQRTSSMDFSLAVGVNVTATYGFVTVNGSTNLGLNTSESTSQTIASTYAKDVVDRSVTRVQERVRNVRETRSFDEIIEANLHGFDNTQSPNHVVGVYRWLDKIYLMRLVNYGRRLMIEVQVPEPAAFLRWATRSERERALAALEWPIPPDSEDPKAVEGEEPLFSAAGITEQNYLLWGAAYGAEGIKPPPARRSLVRSLVCDTHGGGLGARVELVDGIVIPEGFRARRFRHRRVVSVAAKPPDRVDYCLQLMVGGEKVTLEPADSELWTYSGSNVEWDFSNDLTGWTTFSETGPVGEKIPITVVGVLHQNFAIHVEIEIEPVAESLEQWRITTYEAVSGAYAEKLAAVEDQRRRIEVERQSAERMRNPAENRAIVERELKRGALALITENTLGSPQRFVTESTGAIEPVSAAADQGRFAQFFEQALEWPAMTFSLYPYFWANPTDGAGSDEAKNWSKLLTSEHSDTLMKAFLQAGYARCVLPVRPGYERLVVDYLYLRPADPWGLDGLPTFGDGSDDPRYVSIAEELAAPQSEEVEAQWQVRVPTELIILQQDATLPCRVDPQGVRP